MHKLQLYINHIYIGGVISVWVCVHVDFTGNGRGRCLLMLRLAAVESSVVNLKCLFNTGSLLKDRRCQCCGNAGSSVHCGGIMLCLLNLSPVSS